MTLINTNGVASRHIKRKEVSVAVRHSKTPELHLNFIRGNEFETSRIPRKAKRFYRWGIFCFEYPRRRSGKGNVYFANYRFSFRKLQIFISQTTDFHFANYRFSFRKLQIPISQTTDSHFANYRFPFRKLQIFISQTTDFHFANYRFPFRFVPFRFANYSKPTNRPIYSCVLSCLAFE